MKKWLIIFNPQAGSGSALALWPKIEAYLHTHNINYDLYNTQSSGHGKSLVENSTLSSYAAVVAAGGDGTLFEVVNGLMAHESNQRTPLGIIPVGTGNAFARELGLLPTDWQQGIDIIRRGRLTAIDLGLAKTSTQAFYFINIIGMGFVVDAGRATAKIKKLGKSSYTLATLWETVRLKKHPVQLTMTNDQGEVEQMNEDLVFVEVANSRYTGTSFLIAPEAKINDGLLDVIVLKKISRPKILTLFPSIYSGKHINYQEVECRKVRSITIETDAAMPLMPDGEFLGNTPVTIACIEQAIELIS